MGNLLRVLLKDDSHRDVDIFVDFENAKPSEGERQVWEQVDVVLTESQTILRELKNYTGASSFIKEAISKPSDDEIQMAAWHAVIPLVHKLKVYYEFSLRVDEIVPVLLTALCSNDSTPEEHLESQQALVKQFAEIIDFVLTFDDWKMFNPAIQNDFSFYRRTQSRRSMANEENPDEQCVSSETANRMSLFYAESTPMLKTLSNTTANFVSFHKDLPIENTTDCLGTMATICRTMIENPTYNSRFADQDARLFCLRVMVGVIILFDHVHPVGAFCKTSGIEIKSSIKVLKEQGDSRIDGLLNALRREDGRVCSRYVLHLRGSIMHDRCPRLHLHQMWWSHEMPCLTPQKTNIKYMPGILQNI